MPAKEESQFHTKGINLIMNMRAPTGNPEGDISTANLLILAG